MTRLPIPGSDDGTWGQLLNDYLAVAHNSDGTLKAAALPDATGTTGGKIRLAGDLAGTADTPVIAAHAVTDDKIADTAAIALSKLATDPLARNNHTGTQTAASISDFATGVKSVIGTAIIGTAGVIATYNSGSGTVTLTADPSVISATKSADYTLVLADAGLVIESTSSSSVTVTVPPNQSVAFPVGTVIELAQIGSGTLAVAAGNGVTIRTPASMSCRVQYSSLLLRKRATDEWVLGGDLA